METVPRLYPQVRPVAKYGRSLDLLRWAHEERFAGMYTKSSVMLGLGETEDEVLAVAADLRAAGVDIFTMGQYLAPSERHHPVRRYYSPAEFAELGKKAKELGFHHVESAPLVRSSYMAHRAVESPVGTV
jgi:lipoic acid synthetase